MILITQHYLSSPPTALLAPLLSPYSSKTSLSFRSRDLLSKIINSQQLSSPNIVTTGHNAEGLSVLINNPQCKNFSPSVGMLYSTGSSVPIDLNKSADIAFENRDYSGLIPKQGSGVLIIEWPPGADGLAKIHRTMSVDVGVMMVGQSTCFLCLISSVPSPEISFFFRFFVSPLLFFLIYSLLRQSCAIS